MHRVTTDNRILLATSGTLLSDLLMQEGEPVDHPCGGRGVCKKCAVLVNGIKVLACQYRIFSDITVSGYADEEIISQTGILQTGCMSERQCLALDVGTTTLALAVVSLDDGSVQRVITATNPQRGYGADVMTRIGYCRKGGLAVLHSCLINKINSMIESLQLQPVEQLFVSGNTTMLHLLLGVDCSSMGAAPYTPAFLESRAVSAEVLGIIGAETVITLPSISAFVGADLVAGMHYVGMPQTGKYHLIVDLGTNAEIVLYSREGVLCTAAAAGPCFEGANITCGSSAISGAVYAYEKGIAKTVSDKPARGICGTGLVDIMAELLRAGIIDETGYMECEQFSIAEDVFITRSDIRQYQLAKSAVCSAILTLLQLQGIAVDDIEAMHISGGFSAQINVANAVFTGLLPEELSKKCVPIRNSSLSGTCKYAYLQEDLSMYCSHAKYVDLSNNPVFSELFINKMFFVNSGGLL